MAEQVMRMPAPAEKDEQHQNEQSGFALNPITTATIAQTQRKHEFDEAEQLQIINSPLPVPLQRQVEESELEATDELSQPQNNLPLLNEEEPEVQADQTEPDIPPHEEIDDEATESSDGQMPDDSLAAESIEPAEPLQMRSVQTKLAIGQPDDQYEQEADHMAAQVMAMPPAGSPLIQRLETEKAEPETEEIQTKPLVDSISPLVQRQVEEETEEIQTKPGQPHSGLTAGSLASSSLDQLASQKGGGSSLGEDVRSFMESRFGADFSRVRVHTDSSAIQMNKELKAQAFTHGSDIYFGAGKLPGKNELTAHELTHTIQQTGRV